MKNRCCKCKSNDISFYVDGFEDRIYYKEYYCNWCGHLFRRYEKTE